jgi:hypothetical protein
MSPSILFGTSMEFDVFLLLSLQEGGENENFLSMRTEGQRKPGYTSFHGRIPTFLLA